MSSERRINASRANGSKSPGPNTPESKARSAANSLRHGLLAQTVVLEGESAAFEEILTAFERDLDPQNQVERSLVENMAIGRFRLVRLWAIEKSNLKLEMDKHDPQTLDSATRAALAFRALGDESRALDLLNRYETRFHREFDRSLTLLLKIRQAASPIGSAEDDFCQTTLVPNSDTDVPSPDSSTDPSPSADSTVDDPHAEAWHNPDAAPSVEATLAAPELPIECQNRPANPRPESRRHRSAHATANHSRPFPLCTHTPISISRTLRKSRITGA